MVTNKKMNYQRLLQTEDAKSWVHPHIVRDVIPCSYKQLPLPGLRLYKERQPIEDAW